jgi:hypothetical protein
MEPGAHSAMQDARKAMQAAITALLFKRDQTIRRIYHEAPDDVFELFVIQFSDKDDGWGKGGLNVLRLVNKRLMRVVESCATMLTHVQTHHDEDGPESFPLSLRLCTRIKHITCRNSSLRSLEGCPNGLKSLYMSDWRYGGPRSIISLEPLKRCTELESLEIWSPSIGDLCPFSCCTRIKKLSLFKSPSSTLSPLSSMSLLEKLTILACMKIKSLNPLSGLMNLQMLNCHVNPQTSLLPLASCTGLKKLKCDQGAMDLEVLRRNLPGLRISHSAPDP